MKFASPGTSTFAITPDAGSIRASPPAAVLPHSEVPSNTNVLSPNPDGRGMKPEAPRVSCRRAGIMPAKVPLLVTKPSTSTTTSALPRFR